MAEVTPTGAKLRAEINPNGLGTSYHFEYISDSSYRANLEAVPPRESFDGAGQVPSGKEPPVGSGTVPLPVVQQLSGLASATAYHYRPVATSSAGTVVGPEHVLTTQETQLIFRLPDNRAWELVSPVDKAGGAVAAPEALFGGGDIQAASIAPADPTAPLLTYGSATAFADPSGAPPAGQYVARRTGLGWTTENVSTPLDSGAYGDEPDGTPYRVFSADLSRALLFGGLPCRGGLEGCPAPNPPLAGTGAPAGYMAYYLRDNAGGGFLSLLGPADVAHSQTSPQGFEVAFAAASPDLSHLVLSSCAALTPDAEEIPAGPGRCDATAPNLYEWSAAGLRSVNVLPGEVETTAGAEVAAPSGAVSTDGSRIYWTRGGDLYLRDGAETVQVDKDQGGGGVFQTATPDGSVAFFTAPDGHLYRFVAATKAAADLTPAGGVMGVLGASADGSHVYYQDAAGLELWHGGIATTVAPGANAAAASNYPPVTGTARVSADGAHIAFLSRAELTGYDNADAGSGQPDTELYLYGPPLAGGPATLVCASCNPTGERPQGSSTIPGALVNGSTRAYKPRALSGDGTRVFFDSAAKLVPQDTNSRPDVYEWELEGAGDCLRSPGCVALVSSGRSTGGATFLDATANGSDVFFITNESLVGADPAGSIDAYDARVGGGFSEAQKPIPCVGDACQGLQAPPDDPTPGTLIPNSGNPPLRFFEPKQGKHPKKHHKKRRRGNKHRGETR